MSQYSQMSREFLKTNNPEELERLKKEGKLQEFEKDLTDLYEDQEQTIVEQMTKDLPENYEDRAVSLKQAKMVAREQSRADMKEFLQGL